MTLRLAARLAEDVHAHVFMWELRSQGPTFS
jgi:hypothetical protein